MERKKQGMKWFKFFTQVVPLFSILELILAIIMLFNAEYRRANFANVWTSIFEVIAYVQVIMIVVLYFMVKKKYKHTVGYIHALLIIQSIDVVYGVIITDSEINSSIYAVCLLAFMTLIMTLFLWYLPNIKYFEKRKWYFQNKEQEEPDPKYVEEMNIKTMRRINKMEKVIMSILLGVAAITSLVSAAIIEVDSDYLDYLKEEVGTIKEKADFLDENVVFLIEGDEEYYYTYDQVMQFPEDKTYYYWVCTDAEAEDMGYEKWQ